LLGAKGWLKWRAEGRGFVVEIPGKHQKNPPCKNAWVVKIS
jgi:hypothetical protein